MWLQQKLNPAPTDPTQQMIFAWMPWVFMFMLGSFASGLVVYWIANNTITFTQQYAIMRSHGYKPDLFGNIKRASSASRSRRRRHRSNDRTARRDLAPPDQVPWPRDAGRRCTLTAGQALPWDRRWAVAHEAALDADGPRWAALREFLASAPRRPACRRSPRAWTRRPDRDADAIPTGPISTIDPDDDGDAGASSTG